MIELALASLFLWKNVPDSAPLNLSIGNWQVSRVYALLEDGAQAVLFAEKAVSEAESDGVDPFYLTYGHEAMAHGYKILGNALKTEEHIALAHAALAKSEEKETEGLIADLKELAQA